MSFEVNSNEKRVLHSLMIDTCSNEVNFINSSEPNATLLHVENYIGQSCERLGISCVIVKTEEGEKLRYNVRSSDHLDGKLNLICDNPIKLTSGDGCLVFFVVCMVIGFMFGIFLYQC